MAIAIKRLNHSLRVCLMVCGLASLNTYAIENSAAVKVTPVLKTTKSWDGTLLKYPEGQAEISGMIIEIAPEGTTGWHLHPVPSFGMLLEGTLEVHLKDGRTLVMHEGGSLAEVVNTLHSGKNIGTKPVKILVFYAGAVGTPLSVKEKQ
jgi:quercetin dioxygenase-like cupin family protein